MTRTVSLLSVDDVVTLTGWVLRRRQCEALVAMGIPFARNVIGSPLVPRSFIDGEKARGRQEAKELQQKLDDTLKRHQEENVRDALIRRK